MYGCLLSPYDERDYKAKDYIAIGAKMGWLSFRMNMSLMRCGVWLIWLKNGI